MSVMPNPYPPILLPDPDVLLKYGKVTLAVLRELRKMVKEKGKEHKQQLERIL